MDRIDIQNTYTRRTIVQPMIVPPDSKRYALVAECSKYLPPKWFWNLTGWRTRCSTTKTATVNETGWFYVYICHGMCYHLMLPPPSSLGESEWCNTIVFGTDRDHEKNMCTYLCWTNMCRRSRSDDVTIFKFSNGSIYCQHSTLTHMRNVNQIYVYDMFFGEHFVSRLNQ